MKDIYERNVRRYGELIDSLVPELASLSYTRLAIFLITGVLVMLFAAAGWLVPVCIVAVGGIVLFVMTLKKYNVVTDRKNEAQFLKQINEGEIKRLENNLSEFPTGSEFQARNHHYTADLDIFGQHSVFQLLNRTTTESGAKLLAEWLSAPAATDVITKRQAAVRELAGDVEWRQRFQAVGMPFESTQSDYRQLLDWIDAPEQLLPERSRYRAIQYGLGALSTVALGWFLYKLAFDAANLSWLHLLPVIIANAINSRVLKKFRIMAEDIILHTQRNILVLGGYQALVASIRGQEFRSERLRELFQTLTQPGHDAALEIGKLKRTLEIFQHKGTRHTVGQNAFYGMMNNFWLIDIHFILNTEAWKSHNRAHIRSWVDAVSEMEALASLAGFLHANPGYAFPELASEDYCIDFQDAGHPLLKSERRVNNDFNIHEKGSIAMITGSNMAGKSTFLRTLGVNLVLAFAGAPCCASRSRISPLRVFTSMRTQDNLEESVSSFYAELQRIEQLLHLVEQGEPIFFLLDEMFKGTNSQDRFRGAVSLIRQLSELNAFGIISTHDLDLARLTADLPINNYSFNSDIHDGQIRFDYKLTKGICTDFNASELMKRSGIRILADLDNLKS